MSATTTETGRDVIVDGVRWVDAISDTAMLTSRQKLVLYTLNANMVDHGYAAVPSATLADGCGLGVRALKTVLGDLGRFGWIDVDRQWRPHRYLPRIPNPAVEAYARWHIRRHGPDYWTDIHTMRFIEKTAGWDTDLRLLYVRLCYHEEWHITSAISKTGTAPADVLAACRLVDAYVQALPYSCPSCGAEEDEWCVTAAGVLADRPHAARIGDTTP